MTKMTISRTTVILTNVEVLFMMVRKYCYLVREIAKNSFDFQPSKIKRLKVELSWVTK